ncbi:MAG: hypothetical protein CM15mV25_0430 [uncultured marine virus]|nr:MAG: hypothetical protein CM15mV25_0430 [uncultured marine virus]
MSCCGVAYNGYCNEMFTKNGIMYLFHCNVTKGIECYQHADYTINGNVHKSNLYAVNHMTGIKAMKN